MNAVRDAGAFGGAVMHRTYAVFIHDPDDMVGHVAYALYKRDKLDFCESVRERHAREATTAELDAFIHAANLPTRVQAYRVEAVSALESMCEASLEVTLDQAQAEMDAELVRQLKEAKSWWRAVGENLVANLLALAVTTLLVVLVYVSRYGAMQLLADTLGYEIKEKTPATEPARDAR
ncbi:MAG TPA: hypothetical protein VJ724_02760 [Tahibacter sp.]|nr:hypothetical protein [Tahibacter sp.]